MTGPKNLNLGASFAPSLRNAASAVDLTRQNVQADISGQLPYSSGTSKKEGSQEVHDIYDKADPDEESIIIRRPPKVGKRAHKRTEDENLQEERSRNPFR
jgi:hypothetical protein